MLVAAGSETNVKPCPVSLSVVACTEIVAEVSLKVPLKLAAALENIVRNAFEAMPDSQLRAALTPAAKAGAAAGVHWVEPMRKRAQNRSNYEMEVLEEVALCQDTEVPTVVDGRLEPRINSNKDLQLCPIVGVITAIAEQFGLRFWRDETGSLSHNLRAAVIDASGRVRKIFEGNKWTSDELVAEMVKVMGHNIYRYFTGVFAAGSALAGVGGLMWAIFSQSVRPAMGGEQLIFAFIVVIIGGLGSVTGSLVGALLVGLSYNYVAYLVPKAAIGVTMALMVIVLLLRPTGLYGAAK